MSIFRFGNVFVQKVREWSTPVRLHWITHFCIRGKIEQKKKKYVELPILSGGLSSASKEREKKEERLESSQCK